MKRFTLLAVLAAWLMPMLSNAQSTDCTTYTSVPYSTGFEGISTDSLPSCWLQLQTGANGGHTFPCVYNYSGNTRTGSCYLEFESSTGNSDTEIVALPMMQDISTLKISMWVSSSSSYGCTLEIGVLESGNVFVPVDTLDLITFVGANGWKENYHLYTVYLNNYTGSGERIAMRAVRSGSGQFTLFVDDLSVSDGSVPMVALPATATTNINTDLVVTGSVQGPTNGVSYAWTSTMYDAGNATMSNVDNVLTINYTAAGIDTIAFIAYNTTGGDTATMIVRAMDLTPVTVYPYNTGFETGDDANWNFVNGTNGWCIGSAVNNGGSNAMYISNDNGTSNAYTNNSTSDSYAYRYFQLDAGEYSYSFDWRCNGEASSWGATNYDYMRFYLASNDADFSGTTVSTSGWTNLSGDLLSQSSWQTQTGTFTVATTGLYPIVFYWRNDISGGSNPPAAIDNIILNQLSCPAVSGIVLDSVSDETMTIHWHPVGTESEWEVTFGDNDPETVSNDTIYTAYNLNPNTSYTVSVRAVCGANDTSFATTASFRTACGIVTIPYNESFEGDGALSCWSQSGPGSWSVATSSAHTGASFAKIQHSNNGNVTKLISPVIDLSSVSGCQLTFWHMQPSWSGDQDQLRVYYRTEDTASWVLLATYTDDISSWTEETLFLPNPSATYQVAFEMTDGWGYGISLDDVNFALPPSCMPASLPYVDNITSDGASIHWTAPEGQNSFIVRIDSTDYNVSGDEYTITGLDARTSYTAWVASDCGSDTSTWVSVDFTTDCASGSCNITVAMTGNYSWGASAGGELGIYQNGSLVEKTSISGYVSSATATVNVCAGLPVTFRWISGQYPSLASDCAFTIYDGSNAVVYSCTSASGLDSITTVANACPSCLVPTGVRATAIDSSSITFVWTEDPNVAGYLISFNGEDYTANYNGTETYTDLNANTPYTFSVRAVCQPGVDTSAASTISVRTACGQMALPLIEDFEAETVGNTPLCWNAVSGATAVASSSYYSHSGSKYLELEGGDLIATSQVPLAGDSIMVSFWADIYSGTLQAGVMTDILADTTFTPLLTINSTNDYEMFEFNTSTLSNDSSYYVAFRFTSTYASASIDDINIRKDEGCMHPTNLVATPVTNGVDLSWTYTGSMNNFAIEYHTGNDAWSAAPSASTTTASINGLNSATYYEVRVGAACGTDTLWVSTTFQTPCGLMDLPYAEDFDAYANDVMPPCWIWSSTFATHWDGGVFLKANHGGGSEYVVLPQLDGGISKLKIEFDAKVGTIAENDGILIGVTDASGTLLAWLDTIQDPNFSRAEHVRKTVYFTNYIMPVGAARVAFAQYRNWNEWALIDNINIEELPDCYPVDNLVGHNLDDIENTTFTWTPLGYAAQWQVYVDTVTVDIDSLYNLPATSFTNVDTTSYTIPIGMIQGGGIYNFFVRSDCGTGHSNWVKYEFGAGTIIMDQTTDTVTGCGFVVYDNGGPIAGYVVPSNNELIIRSENVGSQLEIFGGKFGFGDDLATLTVYDGEGTSGTTLFTYNTIGGRDTMLNTILATSTTGSLTITFSVSGWRAHTGYELYIRCTDGAVCPRPTQLQASMTSATDATVTWEGTANNYNFYYRLHDATSWMRIPTTTNSVSLNGLTADTTYDMYVVAICSATDSSMASTIRQLNTNGSTPHPVFYTVTVSSFDATMGTATADHTGQVAENTLVTATATPNDGYRFTAWTDANGTQVDNHSTYTFTVNGNVTLVAHFESNNGIDDVYGSRIALFPNPANTTVTLTNIDGMATVMVVDMNGREVGRWTTADNTLTIDVTKLAQGTYFVRIVGEQINAVRKLIVR